MVEPEVADGSTTTADAARAEVHKQIASRAVTLLFQLRESFESPEKDEEGLEKLCNNLLYCPLSRGICFLVQEAIEKMSNNHPDTGLVDEGFLVIAELDSVEKELDKVDKKLVQKTNTKSNQLKK